jgi:hypothetical protein
VDSRVNQHGSSDGHDGLDRALGNSVVVMGADSSKLGCLFELG